MNYLRYGDTFLSPKGKALGNVRHFQCIAVKKKILGNIACDLGMLFKFLKGTFRRSLVNVNKATNFSQEKF